MQKRKKMIKMNKNTSNREKENKYANKNANNVKMQARLFQIRNDNISIKLVLSYWEDI